MTITMTNILSFPDKIESCKENLISVNKVELKKQNPHFGQISPQKGKQEHK